MLRAIAKPRLELDVEAKQVHVREGDVADAAAVARVQVDTWRTAYAGIVPDEHLARLSYEQSTERWRNNLASMSGFLYVAENDRGQVVGFAVGGQERDGDPIYKGEIYAIYVLESYQKQGLGRRLVEASARHLLAEGINSLLIWVLAENPDRAFYEALGGQPVAKKEIVIGGAVLDEVGYGWRDIDLLALGRVTRGDID